MDDNKTLPVDFPLLAGNTTPLEHPILAGNTAPAETYTRCLCGRMLVSSKEQSDGMCFGCES